MTDAPSIVYPTGLRVLAIDIGTQTGFAQLANGILTSGSVGFHRYKGSQTVKADHDGQPYLSMHKWLRNLISQDRPDCLVYEEVFRWMSADAARTFGAYRGQILLLAAHYDIPCHGYAPAQIKKYWTGRGTADKAAMRAAMLQRLPAMKQARDDNEVDAVAILHLHLQQQGAFELPVMLTT
jgi:Holliday junction resolvasome RuvABC endonuclease subunit